METKGRLTNIKPNISETTIEITLDNAYLEHLEKLLNKDIKVSLCQWREPRSNSANGYFYVLVGKLADALRVSKPYIHNLMLRKYGQIERIDGKPVWVILPETEEVSHKVDEDESIHLRATDDVREGVDGKMYRTYLLLKGSHTFNSKEMNILLDGIISDCKEQGISVATPDEIKRMKEMWGVEIK